MEISFVYFLGTYVFEISIGRWECGGKYCALLFKRNIFNMKKIQGEDFTKRIQTFRRGTATCSPFNYLFHAGIEPETRSAD